MSKTKTGRDRKPADLRLTLVGWAPDSKDNPIKTRKRKAKSVAKEKLTTRKEEKSPPKPRGPPKQRELLKPRATAKLSSRPKARAAKPPRGEDGPKAADESIQNETTEQLMPDADNALAVSATPVEAAASAVEAVESDVEAAESDVGDTIIVSTTHVDGDSSPTDGFDKVHRYVNQTDMRKIISERSKNMDRSSTSQYVAFKNVTKDALGKIENARSNVERRWRMTHYMFPDIMIAKLLGGLDKVVSDFSDMIVEKLDAMGVTDEDMYFGIAKSVGHHTSKEADLAYKPLPARSGDKAWPTIVIEAGISESLARMRKSAGWWLTESGGQVNTVLIIVDWVHSIEKWELDLSAGGSEQVPICVQTISFGNDQDDNKEITRGPVVLEFEKMFSRPPEPSESDIVFAEKELLAWRESYQGNVIQDSITVE